jgi:hypothetical protein
MGEYIRFLTQSGYRHEFNNGNETEYRCDIIWMDGCVDKFTRWS